MSSIDRYRVLLQEAEIGACLSKLRDLERRVQFGDPASTERSILEDELEELRDRGNRDRARSGSASVDLLILSVGTSAEPLVLTVAYHAPRAVTLLVEDSLPPAALADFEKLWSRYSERLGLEFPDRKERLRVREGPADVFRVLRSFIENLQEPDGSRIVVDVTGGKKSLVVGAFLAAGYLGVEASYVDFSEYDSVLRRPLPGSVSPGGLVHPENLFRLREEKRLVWAFDERRFEEAKALAESLLEMVASPEVRTILDPEECERLARRYQTTAALASAYSRWSAGFYVEAATGFEAAGIPLPMTVAVLERLWPGMDVEPSEIPKHLDPHQLAADPEAVASYLLDVLVWIDEAFLERHPRDGFLRLYGAWEALIFYLFELWVARKPEDLEPVPPAIEEELSGNWREQVAEQCRANSTKALSLLRGKRAKMDIRDAGHEKQEVKAKVRFKGGQGIPSDLAKRLLDEKIGDRSRGSFVDLRHKATHWLAPVPRKSARWMRRFFVESLRELIPLAVSHCEDQGVFEKGDHERLVKAAERLLAGAEGRLSESCRPWTYRELLGWLDYATEKPTAIPSLVGRSR